MSSKAKQYQKKTPREHVLLRPDTYIGDIEETKEEMLEKLQKLEETLISLDDFKVYKAIQEKTKCLVEIEESYKESVDKKGNCHKLKKIIEDLDLKPNSGLIIRTAGGNRTKTEIKRDYEFLLKAWESIREQTLSSIAPTLIHAEGNLIKRAIRDLYDRDIKEIIVEGDAAYKEAKAYLKLLMP